jgi:lysozyme
MYIPTTSEVTTWATSHSWLLMILGAAWSATVQTLTPPTEKSNPWYVKFYKWAHFIGFNFSQFKQARDIQNPAEIFAPKPSAVGSFMTSALQEPTPLSFSTTSPISVKSTVTVPTTVTDTYINTLKEEEGLLLECVHLPIDKPGINTWKYGEIGCTLGDKTTEAEADASLRKKVQVFADEVHQEVTVTVDQHQFEALVDFSYNKGNGAFKNSTLLKKLNAGDFTGADREFLRWVYVGNHKVGGLIARAEMEEKEFAS